MDGRDLEIGVVTIFNDGAPIGSKQKKDRKQFKNPLKRGKLLQSLVPVFDMLPDELVVRIHTFLDAPTAGRAAQVSRRFNLVSHDSGMWREISMRGNWSNFTPSKAVMPLLSRQHYVNDYLAFKKHLKNMRAMERDNARARRRNQCIDRSGVAMLALLLARPYEWVSMLSTILFTVFLLLKLDNIVLWSWPTVFAPILVVLYQMFITPIVYDVLQSSLNHEFESEFDPERPLRPIFFLVFFLIPLRTRKNLNRVLLYTLTVLIPVFFVLLLLRITAVPLMSWWLVCLPWLILCVHFCFTPLVIHTYIWNDTQWFDRVVCSIGGVILLAFFFLLIPKLEYGMKISWFGVMTPLFILSAAILVVPLLYNILLCCVSRRWVAENSRWSEDPVAFNVTAAVALLLVAVPLMVFEILLAQKLQGAAISYKLIFVPLLVIEGFAFCGCCGMDLVMVL